MAQGAGRDHIWVLCMTFFLKVVNEKNNVILGDGVLPYRYTRVAMLPTWINMNSTGVYYAGFLVPELTETSMIALDVSGALLKAKSSSIVAPYSGPFYVTPMGGGYAVILKASQYRIDQRYWEFVVPPKLYVIDKTTPSNNPTSGFGIKVLDDNGAPLLNSSTPLVKVLSNHVVTTPANNIGDASSTLLFIHTPPPTADSGFIDYAGGDAPYWAGTFFNQGVQNGKHYLDHLEWFEEYGEGVEYKDAPVTLMVSLVEKP